MSVSLCVVLDYHKTLYDLILGMETLSTCQNMFFHLLVSLESDQSVKGCLAKKQIVADQGGWSQSVAWRCYDFTCHGHAPMLPAVAEYTTSADNRWELSPNSWETSQAICFGKILPHFVRFWLVGSWCDQRCDRLCSSIYCGGKETEEKSHPKFDLDRACIIICWQELWTMCAADPGNWTGSGGIEFWPMTTLPDSIPIWQFQSNGGSIKRAMKPSIKALTHSHTVTSMFYLCLGECPHAWLTLSTLIAWEYSCSCSPL